MEYAGEVESVGSGGFRWRIGDRVMGLVGGGAHAEYVVVHENEILPIPENLSFAEAAAIPEAFLTAFDALTARGRVQPGEWVLIHAVASGVGTAAIQLAKTLGASVIGTSRTPSKLEPLASLGLDRGIDTSTRPFRELISRPVNVILDVLGGPAFMDNLALLAPRGRLVLLGFLQGPKVPEASLELILRKRLEVVGTTMRSRGLEERAVMIEEFGRRYLPMFGEHLRNDSPMLSLGHPESSRATLRPIIHAVFPMADIVAAHETMERNDSVGKIVMVW
jgi:NADPH:quinone reductase-like Zn-dependent oxidoreductase